VEPLSDRKNQSGQNFIKSFSIKTTRSASPSASFASLAFGAEMKDGKPHPKKKIFS
jgi:hypothetical protein